MAVLNHPTPAALRRMDLMQLSAAAALLRRSIIEAVAQTGGHLASSLGAVEIALAVHHVFNTPQDRIVWDIGHQAYAHKLLTGRELSPERGFRRLNGVSGFLKRRESEFDCFGAGHAGTSISAALGICAAGKRRSEEQKCGQQQDGRPFTIAVIGDGSLAAGMALEALNHAVETSPQRLIVILNDNRMSISPSVGALSKCTPEDLREIFRRLGFACLGPVDGNDLIALVPVLCRAKDLSGPVFVHTRTCKGKGFLPAQRDPQSWHAASPFPAPALESASICTAPAAPEQRTFTDAFGAALLELALRDRRVIGITAAMAQGTGLNLLRDQLPESFFDAGICEQHAAAFAAGLAAEGMRPVCALYSTFMQRAYDQIIHDAAIQRLPVVFALDRAGMVGLDGETHQGLFDIAALRAVPNLVIMAPHDERELRSMLYTALTLDGPSVIRFPRANLPFDAPEAPFTALPIGRADVAAAGEDGLLIALGPLVHAALEVRRILLSRHGLRIAVINARFAKPLDAALLARELPRYPLIATWEDHALAGGFGSAVLELVNDADIPLSGRLKRFGAGDSFTPQGTQEEQRRMNAYSSDCLIDYFAHALRGRKRLAAAAKGTIRLVESAGAANLE